MSERSENIDAFQKAEEEYERLVNDIAQRRTIDRARVDATACGNGESSKGDSEEEEQAQPRRDEHDSDSPDFSYRIITKDLKHPEEIGVIALQHHERLDGMGYPRKLKGEEINLAARIVSVADAYVSMINNRPCCKAMSGYKAMKNTLNDNGRHFDPKILKAFLEIVGIYLIRPEEPPRVERKGGGGSDPPSGGFSGATVPRPPSGAPHGTISESLESPKEDDDPN